MDALDQLPPGFAERPRPMGAIQSDDARSRLGQGCGCGKIRCNAQSPVTMAFLYSNDGYIRVLPDSRNVFRAVDTEATGSSAGYCSCDPSDGLGVFEGVAKRRLAGDDKVTLQLFPNRKHFLHFLVFSTAQSG
jgi:hypothetical protein